MTLEELVRETLVEKHLRLRQERCKHNGDTYISCVASPEGTFVTVVCLDCGKSWHESKGLAE